jgi:hypothetical protein
VALEMAGRGYLLNWTTLEPPFWKDDLHTMDMHSLSQFKQYGFLERKFLDCLLNETFTRVGRLQECETEIRETVKLLFTTTVTLVYDVTHTML